MKGWLRWLGVLLGAFVALVLAGAGVLAYLVSRIDVRAEVERAVEGATGRDLAIAGNVGVSYWPVLGLHAANATLANVPGGRSPAFLTADDIHVGVELQPLLRREVRVRSLVLQQPRIALEVDEQGRPNWILTPVRTPPAVPPPPGPPPRPSQQPVSVARTTLQEVRIDDGEASYFDARRGEGWQIGEINLRTALTSLSAPMHVEGAFRYNDRPVDINVEIDRPGAALRGQATPLTLRLSSELLTAAFNGQTTAASGEMAGVVQASGPSFRQLATWTGAPIQGGVGLEQFRVSGRLAIGGGRHDFSNASFEVDHVRGRGDFVLSDVRNKPYLSGRLELLDFDLNPYLGGRQPVAEAEAAATAPAAPQAGESAPRALDVRAAPSERPIDFSGLQAINADLELITHAVTLQHMRIDSGRLNLVLNDGYLAATLHNLSLYGGSGSGRFEIDAREAAPRMVQDLVFSGVNARDFLTDAINFSNIEGRADLTLQLRTTGRTQEEMTRAADGMAHLEVVSGVLHGVDLGGVAATIRNAMRGELIAPEASTAFQGFSANFAVADGVLASDSVSFNTADLRIPGLAIIDIPARRLDARLAPRSPRGGIVWPFAVRGPWGQLAYDGDLNDRVRRELTPRIAQIKTAARAP